MINILIVDDSLTESLLLKTIFESDPQLKVIGIAKDGQEGVALASQLKPNIITMDIEMPVMDGLEATKIIMAKNPTPIIIISSKLNNNMLNPTYRALSIGALSVFDKPKDINSINFNHEKNYLINMIKAMSEIKVITRKFNKEISLNGNNHLSMPKSPHGDYKVIIIGTSVGGPQALKMILTALPANFPIPIVIVQHMTDGFLDGFAKWLNQQTQIKVKIADNNEMLQKNVVYIAPDKKHLEIVKSSSGLITHLMDPTHLSGFCPSIDVLMHSVAKNCGKNAIGILLTGMGNDGAEGLLAIRKAGGHTIIQDKESTIVFGMAAVAKSFNAVDKIVKLNEMADYLIKIV